MSLVVYLKDRFSDHCYFLIYINDLCNVSDKLYKVLFADDTTIFYSHKYPDEIVTVLNEELVKLIDWFNCNKWCLNIKKSCYVVGALVRSDGVDVFLECSVPSP